MGKDKTFFSAAASRIAPLLSENVNLKRSDWFYLVEIRFTANTVVVLFFSASRIHHQDVYGLWSVTQDETAPE
ncbi:hypothetical protein [Trichormus variabilis]|uniref:hypothetical protein n=1 Tax=Anabaena variabilis TaxID=264691 RepID=UPI000F8D16BB|nr:hypothetical protein [Trichormus variabilis]MBD2625032.1 hypothetical protein [Trichormus variabilis FACHB-164]